MRRNVHVCIIHKISKLEELLARTSEDSMRIDLFNKGSRQRFNNETQKEVSLRQLQKEIEREHNVENKDPRV